MMARPGQSADQRGEKPIDPDAQSKSEKSAKDAGWMQDQTMFKVNHKDHRKICQKDHTEHVSRLIGRMEEEDAEWGLDPNVDADDQHEALNEPNPQRAGVDDNWDRDEIQDMR